MLAETPRGRIDPIFTARFTAELLDLVQEGLAAVWPKTVRAKGQTTEVARISITEAGRKVLKG